jgi:hypothetical protein
LNNNPKSGIHGNSGGTSVIAELPARRGATIAISKMKAAKESQKENNKKYQ